MNRLESTMDTIAVATEPVPEHTKDKLSEAIGESGRWQILLFIALSIPTKMSAAWTVLGIIFLAPKTTFRCKELVNSTENIINSTCYNNCVAYEYYSEFGNTIISQWDLICGRAWLANFTQTICMLGVLFGSMVFGFLADRYGRRKALLIACMLQLISGFIEPFCMDYWSFTTARFFLGTATAGILVISFVILMEIFGTTKREMIGCIYHLPLAVGQIIMALFAYFLPNWDKFSISVAVPNLIFLIYFLILPESPKWLLSVGKLEEACEVMTKAAKCNNLPSQNMLEIAKSILSDANKHRNVDRLAKASYIDLIRLPSLRMKNFCSCLSWFILGISFYGGNQYIGQTSSNVYVTVITAGALQIPGILLSGYMCKRYGRRTAVIFFLTVSAISNGMLAVPDHMFYVRLTAGSFGVSCGAAAFSALYIYTTELFPTVARNMAVGASSTTSRVGSMLAPFVAGLNTNAWWLPPTVFGIAPIIAAIACCCLPETKGRKLEDHLDES